MSYTLSTQTLDLPLLTPVIRGEAVLARGARGPAVRAVQRALLTLGYALKGGADGAFGPSSEAGLASFRELQRMKGDALLDAAALEALDRSLLRHESAAAYTLSNPRHTDTPLLAKILGGERVLPRRHAAVEVIQSSLLDLRFSMPRWGADGVLGKETAVALARFQAWQKIRPGGELTPLTLMALDLHAPPPGERACRSPNYAALIREGRLTVTVGVGFEQSEVDIRQRAALERALEDEGLSCRGSERGVSRYTGALAIPGCEGQLRVRVVGRSSQDPEDAFAEGLIHDSVSIYIGHARYGTGPDFDAKESPAENFVIGLGAPGHACGALEPGYNAHMNEILAGQPNDLLTRRFDPERDQLWVFAGCTTRNYLDELRALVAGKDSHNLDLGVSTRPLYWSDMAGFALELIRGLSRGEDYDAIHGRLSALARATERRLGKTFTDDPFMFDGLGDNG